MPKIDPLELLRSAYNFKKTQKKLTIKLKGNDLYFDRDIKLPIDTQTAWQSTKTGKQFNLGSLWLYLQLHFQKISNRSEYFKKASQLKLDTIGVADADQVIKYFSGQIEQTTCINAQLKQSLGHKNKGRDKPVTGGQQNFDKIQKKIKVQSNLDQNSQYLLKCIGYLNNFEKPINSKSRCMRYPHKKFYNILTHLIENQPRHSPEPQRVDPKLLGKPRIASIYERKKLPIIIAPLQTIPGNISLQNIQKFLIKGQYDQYDKLANQQASRLELIKNIHGKNIMFEVHSRPQFLTQRDWQNVVCIFVLGRQNQFQHWPYKTHKKIFQHPPGFMIKFPKTPTGVVANWKCTVKTLDPISRISDKQIVRQIWDEIQKYLFNRT